MLQRIAPRIASSGASSLTAEVDWAPAVTEMAAVAAIPLRSFCGFIETSLSCSEA